AQDLVDNLTISGYVNGDESQLVTYNVDHDATIIEQDGIEVRIAPRDVQFQSAKLWQRMLTNVAGPMNNFILSIILFIALVFVQGGVVNMESTKIGNVLQDGAAYEAGLLKGDEIVSVNVQKTADWPEVQESIQSLPSKMVPIEVKRDDQNLTVQAKIGS